MTRIFISHSHSDQEIAEKLIEFLLDALEVKGEDIRCTSVPGHLLPFGTSIGEQLKKDLNNTSVLIALITKDSLRSTWVLFELGSSWAMEKLVIPILGPEITYDNLPGPLKDYPALGIEDDYADYRLTDIVNQLAETLNLTQKISARRDVRKDQFLAQLRAWKSTRQSPDIALQRQVELLQDQLAQKESIIAQFQAQKEQQSNKINLPVDVAELKSKRGVDYTKLRDFLKRGRWERANLETGKVMCQACNRVEEGFLTAEDLDNFPCEDLRIINQLWLNYSQGKFGFSVQAEIFRSLGGTREWDMEIWDDFDYSVGRHPKGYEHLQFSINAPKGHLPARWGVKKWLWGHILLSRVLTCNLCDDSSLDVPQHPKGKFGSDS